MEDEGQPATLFLPSLEFGRQHDGISGDDPSYIKKCDCRALSGFGPSFCFCCFSYWPFILRYLLLLLRGVAMTDGRNLKSHFFVFISRIPLIPPCSACRQPALATNPSNKCTLPQNRKPKRAAMGGPQPVFTASRKPQVVAAGGRRGERSQAKEIKNRSAAGSQGAASGSPAMKLKLKN